MFFSWYFLLINKVGKDTYVSINYKLLFKLFVLKQLFWHKPYHIDKRIQDKPANKKP